MRKIITLVVLAISCNCGTAAIAQQPEMQVGATLMPLEPRQHQVVFTEGEREGERARLQLQQDQGNEWKLQLGDIADIVLFRDNNGDLLLRKIISYEEKNITTYSPPIIVIPANIRPGVDIGQQSQVKIVDMETNKTSHQAIISHNLRSISRRTFYTPAGIYKGYEVQFEQRGSFDMAIVEVDFTGGFVDGAGLVYAQLDYRVDKPMFFGGKHTYVLKLAKPITQE